MAKPRRSEEEALDKLEAIFAKQDEGVSEEERARRLSALKEIASRARARRSKPGEPQPTPANREKSRIPA